MSLLFITCTVFLKLLYYYFLAYLCHECRTIDVKTFVAARHNGSMYAHISVLPTTAASPESTEWMSVQSVPLTKLELPQAGAFQLIGDSAESTVQQLISLVSLIM